MLPIEAVWKAWADGTGEVPEGKAAFVELAECQQFLRSRLAVVRNTRQLRASGRLTAAECARFDGFAKRAVSPEFVADAARELVTTGSLSLRSPIDDRSFVAADSIVSPQNLNFIRFRSETSSLFVAQFVSSCDALVWPEKNLLYVFQHVTLDHLAVLLQYLAGHRKGLESSARSTQGRFAGFIASHGRPAHLFYEIAAGVMIAREHLRESNARLWYYPGQRFASFARILGLQVQEEIRSQVLLNQGILERGGFAFTLGLKYSKAQPAFTHAFDEAFRAALPDLVPREFADAVERLMHDREPVVWFGVTGQKRCWVEQREGIAAIVEAILARWPKAFFVFDGWTLSPEDDRESSLSVGEDRAVVDDILKRIGRPIAHLKTVGMHPVQKVFVAGRTTAFIANHATGSMHVDRFAMRPGVTHNNTLVKVENHTHHDIIRIPDHQVVDVRKDPAQRGDFVDYSIDWRLMLQALLTILKRAGIEAPEAPKAPAPLDAIDACWRGFAGRAPLVAEAAGVADLESADFGRYVQERMTIAHRADPRAYEGLPPAERKSLEEFLKRIDTEEFALDFARQLAEGQAPRLTGPLDGEEYECSGSVLGPLRVNVLRFSRGDRSFFFVQSMSIVDAVIVPDRNLVVTYKHVAPIQVARFVEFVCQEPGILAEASDRRPRSFGGFLVPHQRPQHFFYNAAPGVMLVKECLSAGQKLIYAKGARYLSFADLLGLDCEERVLGDVALGERTREHHRFLVVLGLRYRGRVPVHMAEFDTILCERNASLLPRPFKKRVRLFTPKRRLVWIGVTHKREWIEQREGIAALVSRLAAEFPDLSFVFDGFTSPLDPIAADKAELERDRAVLEEILAGIPDDVKRLVTVGMTPSEKLQVAKRVACFVTHHGAASMFVSRFAHRPGVTHSGRTLAADEHVHFDVVRVPDESIHERKEDGGAYSLDWNVVYSLVAQRLKAGRG